MDFNVGAMKRLLERVYETLQETEGFRRLGMDQQYDEAVTIASAIVDVGPMKEIDKQILWIAGLE